MAVVGQVHRPFYSEGHFVLWSATGTLIVELMFWHSELSWLLSTQASLAEYQFKSQVVFLMQLPENVPGRAAEDHSSA